MKKEYDKYEDVKYWKNLINTLKAIPVTNSQRTAMEEAITAVGKNIPIEPVREDWEPNRCPTCLGDEYYAVSEPPNTRVGATRYAI